MLRALARQPTIVRRLAGAFPTSSRRTLLISRASSECGVTKAMRGQRRRASMPMLKIGTRSFEVSASHVALEAERMFKLSPVRRAHRLERAKSQLARAGGAKGIEGVERGGAARNAAAIILSQGINEI
jgi:hypothetical protein